MRLLSLTLNGTYKGLKDQTFDFQQTKGNIVALIGLNGSGKSQLLELIAESFAFLERKQRKDFTVRRALRFGFTLTYQLSGTTNHSAVSGGMNCGSPLAVAGGINNPIFKADLAKGSKDPVVYIYLNSEWTEIHINSLELPYIIGYSSGLNENLQRSFMKNAVQYFDLMIPRIKRRKKVAKAKSESEIAEINQSYLQRYPKIFKPEHGGITKYKDFLFGVIETDTPVSRMITLDYDSAALFLTSLGVLSSGDVSNKLSDVTYKYPVKVVLKYNLRGGLASEDAIRDIKLFARIANPAEHDINFNIEGVGKSVTLDEFELHGLQYLEGTITWDLNNEAVRKELEESHYSDPITLFRRLYKLQQLGVKNWLGIRKMLRKDDFDETVKKPLKTRLPLMIQELTLSDGNDRTVCFDDLSDGEAQLVQILAASYIFNRERTLFLLDEPETHLNPSWRTFFHSHLSCTLDWNKGEMQRTQVLASTHSPFMVSSLQKENVFLFERDEEGMIAMLPMPSQTYGASFEVLIKKHFGLRSLISQTAVEAVKKQLPKDDSPESLANAKIWIEENLGDSMEKAYLLRKLQN